MDLTPLLALLKKQKENPLLNVYSFNPSVLTLKISCLDCHSLEIIVFTSRVFLLPDGET